MHEESSLGDVAALLALVVRAIQAVNDGVDPRPQICVDLDELVGSETSTYVTCGPSGGVLLSSSCPEIDRALVDRAVWLLGADVRPFFFRQPHRATHAICLPLSVSRARTAALVFSGGTSDKALLERAGHALRAVDVLVSGLGVWVPDHPGDHNRPVSLTPREMEVLRLLADGLLARTIAGRLALSPRTVHHHLGRIYEKLGVTDRLAAVLQAREQGLLSDRFRRALDSPRQLAGASRDPWS